MSLHSTQGLELQPLTRSQHNFKRRQLQCTKQLLFINKQEENEQELLSLKGRFLLFLVQTGLCDIVLSERIYQQE